MKKTLLICLTFLNLFFFGQKKLDIIYKLNGDSLVATLINISDYNVTFSCPEEHVTYTLTRNIIKEILHANGRKEKINEMVVIDTEEDWRKVKITTIPTDVTGLKYKGDILESAINQDRLDEKIKRYAANMKAHIVFLESKSMSNGAIAITCMAYGY